MRDISVFASAPSETSGAFHLWPNGLRKPLPWAAGLPDAALSFRRAARPATPQRELRVEELPLDAASGLPPSASLSDVAARMRRDDCGWVSVLDGKQLAGIVDADAVLSALERRQLDATARDLMSTAAPSCAPYSEVVDAIHLMLARHLRRLPVVDDDGRCCGVLALPVAVAAVDDDPAVRGILEAAVTSPALFARAWW